METQRDNDINIEIARAAKTDSTAMKTISIVTLTFLPATFISVRRSFSHCIRPIELLADPDMVSFISAADTS